MKLFLDILYVLIENALFVAYLHLLLPRVNKDTKRPAIGLVILLSILSYLINKSMRDNVLLGIFLIVIPIIYSYYYLEGKLINKIIKIVCINANLVILNGLFVLVFSLGSNTVYQLVFGPGYIGYCITFLTKLFWFIEYIYLRKYRSEEFQLSQHVWLAISLLLILLVSVVVFVCYELLAGTINPILAILIFISFGIAVLLIYYVCQEMTNSYNKIIENKIYLEATKYEEKLVEIASQKSQEYNKVLHDYRHLIGVIEELENHNQDIKKFIDEIHLEEPQDIIHTDHVVLNYVINEARKKSAALGIDFFGEYSRHIYEGVSDYDMSILMGNLFDNAIEAALKAKEKRIRYVIDSNEYRMIIKVINTYDETQFNDFQTTKENQDKHGFGLSKIHNIVQKYNGVDSIFKKGEEVVHSCQLNLKR